MIKRFVSIWFPYLATDWFSLRHPQLCRLPFVLSTASHGRMLVTATNAPAEAQGIHTGMTVADARAILPSLQVMDDKPGLAEQLLHRLAEWCIRYTPCVSLDLPGGLVLDATGCSHLWKGDLPYVTLIVQRLKDRGYQARAAMADTIGAAWALARYGKDLTIAENSRHGEALLSLPPASLRLDAITIEQLHKLGLRRVSDFVSMPRASLMRRFGHTLLNRLDQAMGTVDELIQPVLPVEPYQERLPCLEPIVTATGIEIALQRLLDSICHRLQQEQKGLRLARFYGYRMDGKTEMVEIGTVRASNHVEHLFRLFSPKITAMAPGPGVELFMLEALKVEDHFPAQEKLWEGGGGLGDIRLAELLDRLGGRIGTHSIHRYLPDEHYWPERSVRAAPSLQEKAATGWKAGKPRPLQLLSRPEPVEVTAPIPDYPPMLFRYKNVLHTVKKADGPERIEQEWWLQEGEHRDYYAVEDEEGRRYWLFRSGHYTGDRSQQWFLHGFFA
ncbi:MAG TPA: DNA polymerase Y family protein [Flavisolibacter sp.]|nr:DNA polymerase Y family protein [Flavisolibacter sp.]